MTRRPPRAARRRGRRELQAQPLSPRTVLASAVLAVAAMAAALSLVSGGCTGAGPSLRPVKIRIGTLPTEDSLPLHVIEQQKLLEGSQVELEVHTFESAQQRDAAVARNEVDGLVGDVPAIAALAERGIPVRAVTIMLGATADEGRVGIAVPKGSPVSQPIQLRNVPIAVAPGTITEYVVVSLLKAEGLGDHEITTLEVEEVRERLKLLLANQVKAAGLPDPLLSVAESRGARVVIDDTKGANLSQTLLAMRVDFLTRQKEAVTALLAADGEAVRKINGDLDKYRMLLAEKAKLPVDIAETYTLNLYPEPRLPAKTDAAPVLAWLASKGRIRPGLTYESIVGPPAGVPAEAPR